jgi:hypothetical protein
MFSTYRNEPGSRTNRNSNWKLPYGPWSLLHQICPDRLEQDFTRFNRIKTLREARLSARCDVSFARGLWQFSPCIQIFFDTLLNLTELNQPWEVGRALIESGRIESGRLQDEGCLPPHWRLVWNSHSCYHSQHQSQIAPIIPAVVVWTLVPWVTCLSSVSCNNYCGVLKGRIVEITTHPWVGLATGTYQESVSRLMTLLYLFDARREILEAESNMKTTCSCWTSPDRQKCGGSRKRSLVENGRARRAILLQCKCVKICIEQ